ncbi:YbaB/EbfC family nucleoid-associated protein [Streptosporangium sp. NBC_01756]|uniref:YbaB/EbfC family nucleoid-associated protein n=1 Tax=Streptosporangium sp. NBC_01756 TaxID=2975950 RepID=UPI002DD94B26|nr:YbaB/EbfC family nucleoid-associated protein [Streptosporangium sp. NBC_01756]WSC83588.1 YbaB/EbfC family nucleoid-associated protein [Streptosporangium sp. NBC_01756]
MDEMDELRRLAEQLSKASAEAEAAVAEWGARKFTGTADKGGVVATVDAVGNLLALDISVLSKRRHDGVTLGDAVVVAIHAAEQAAAEAKATMAPDLRMGSGPGPGDLLGDAQRAFEARTGLKGPGFPR